MRFGVLGLLQVHDGAGNTRPVAGARQRILLAALLVRANRVMPAAELAEIVWNGAPPAGAAALRTQVMRLRRALNDKAGSRIVTRDPGYMATLTAEELDATLFEGLHQDAGASVRAGRWREAVKTLSQALELWRGPALLDVDSQVLREEWADRLEQLRVQAVEWRADAEMHLGRHEQLVPQLRDLARQYPLKGTHPRTADARFVPVRPAGRGPGGVRASPRRADRGARHRAGNGAAAPAPSDPHRRPRLGGP